jgi:hypothetical protein
MGFTFSGGHYVPWVTNPIDDLRRASGLLSFLAILTERRLWLDGSRKPYEVVLQLPFGLLPSQGPLTSYRSFPPVSPRRVPTSIWASARIRVKNSRIAEQVDYPYLSHPWRSLNYSLVNSRNGLTPWLLFNM